MDLGDIITDDKGYIWTVEKTPNVTGWAVYRDTTYTSGSPLTITQGSTDTILNDGGNNIDTYLPTNVTTFYNESTNKITPQNVGDYYILTIRFKAQNTNVFGYATVGVDIGGSLGVRFKEVIIFPKGVSTTHDFSIEMPFYSLDTFIANGGIPKLNAELGNVTMWDIEFQIARTHKAG
jgi:hypothetical protein